MEAKVSRMKVLQSFFCFLLLNANTVIRRMILLFIVPFSFSTFPSTLSFGKVTECKIPLLPFSQFAFEILQRSWLGFFSQRVRKEKCKRKYA